MQTGEDLGEDREGVYRVGVQGIGKRSGVGIWCCHDVSNAAVVKGEL